MWMFSHLKLCLATAIHNSKRLEITWICEIQVTTCITVREVKIYLTFQNWPDKCLEEHSKPRVPWTWSTSVLKRLTLIEASGCRMSAASTQTCQHELNKHNHQQSHLYPLRRRFHNDVNQSDNQQDVISINNWVIICLEKSCC